MIQFANDPTLTVRANDCHASPFVATITKGFGSVCYTETVAAFSASRKVWQRTSEGGSGFNAPLTPAELNAIRNAAGPRCGTLTAVDGIWLS